MAKPSEDHSHRGTFGCNGEYIWRAYSSGTDSNPENYPVIDRALLDWQPIEGSNDLYAFRARHEDPSIPEMECWFVPCYCAASRDANATRTGPATNTFCPYRHITGEPFWVQVPRKAQVRRRASTRARARAARARGATSDSGDSE